MNSMQNLPVSTSTFRDIIKYDFLYVDKTQHIYNLLKNQKGAYFLARPRRFGKSLLVSTLRSLFAGQKELFQNLWITQHSDYDFQTYPIFHLDFSHRVTSLAELIQIIHYALDEIATQYQLTLTETYYITRFAELLSKLGQLGRVVILIDEYDKPILDNLHSPARDEIKEALKGFYTVIKASDEYLRFVLLTGVTKFAKVSVFSGLNNLQDLTMDERYADMLGITQTELETYFADRLPLLAEKENLSLSALLDKIRFWYNGYRFSTRAITVYNPYSTLHLFEEQQFKFHWFETGTPTFLINLIKEKQWSELPKEKIVLAEDFASYEIEKLQLLPLLFQTGYLTITDVSGTTETLYQLDYPNLEVKVGFIRQLLADFTDVAAPSSYLFKIVKLFKQNDLNEVLETLKIFFANIPYSIQIAQEKYYQTIFFAIFELLGFEITTEVKTNRGRIDAVVQVEGRVYIFEFKLFGTKDEALAQIKQQKYYEKFLATTTEIYLIGVEFSQTERNIGQWIIERVP